MWSIIMVGWSCQKAHTDTHTHTGTGTAFPRHNTGQLVNSWPIGQRPTYAKARVTVPCVSSTNVAVDET